MPGADRDHHDVVLANTSAVVGFVVDLGGLVCCSWLLLRVGSGGLRPVEPIVNAADRRSIAPPVPDHRSFAAASIRGRQGTAFASIRPSTAKSWSAPRDLVIRLQSAEPYDCAVLYQVLGPVVVVDGERTVNLGGPSSGDCWRCCWSSRSYGSQRTTPRGALAGRGARERAAHHPDLCLPVAPSLGDGYLRTTAVGYELDLNGALVDATRFGDCSRRAPEPAAEGAGALDEALTLWRGPALGEFGTEWWAAPFVRKYEELRLNALAERIDAMAARGWEAGALAEVAGLVSEHPLHEPFSSA